MVRNNLCKIRAHSKGKFTGTIIRNQNISHKYEENKKRCKKSVLPLLSIICGNNCFKNNWQKIRKVYYNTDFTIFKLYIVFWHSQKRKTNKYHWQNSWKSWTTWSSSKICFKGKLWTFYYLFGRKIILWKSNLDLFWPGTVLGIM